MELYGCTTQGDAMKELRENMQEALNLYLEEPEDSDILPPLPNEKNRKVKNIEKVKVDPMIAISLLLKHYRIDKGKKQAEMKKLLNFNNIFMYQRLEHNRSDLRMSTLDRIKEAIPDFDLNAVFS